MNGSTHYTLNRFNNQYVDVDDILTTQERVMCNFEVPVLNMGMTHSANNNNNSNNNNNNSNNNNEGLWVIRSCSMFMYIDASVRTSFVAGDCLSYVNNVVMTPDAYLALGLRTGG